MVTEEYQEEEQQYDPYPFKDNRFTDTANAEWFAYLFGKRVRYCGVWKKWLVYNGRYWEEDTTGSVDRLAKRAVRGLYKMAADEDLEASESKRIAKHAIRTESNHAMKDMLERAQKELPIEVSELDQHKHLLNVKNGTIDLRTGVRVEHKPGDMLTKCIDIDYKPDATCPKWIQTLNDIFKHDQELIEFMQCSLGMTFSGDVSQRRVYFCYGIGNNGKTLILNVVRKIAEKYGHVGNVESFLVRKADEVRADLADMCGARMVTASEIRHGARIDEATLKHLTGNEPITARRHYGHFFTFMPEFTPWLAVNHKPVIKDTTDSIWERVYLVPFEQKFKVSDGVTPLNEGELPANTHLEDELIEEAEGILAWIVAGCKRWYKDGLKPPNKVLAATREYRYEQDMLARFLNERCKAAPDSKVLLKLFHAEYAVWCKDNEEEPLSNKEVSASLLERGYKKTKSKEGVQILGLAFKQRGEKATGDDEAAQDGTQNGAYKPGFGVRLHMAKDATGTSLADIEKAWNEL